MSSKNIQPVHKGRAKVPVVMQLEALECGAACLAMILAYYRKWVPLEQVRIDCGVSRDGSNAKNILMAARNHGMNAGGYKMEPEALREKGTFPCIIHWNFNHFVVCCGFKGKYAYLNDPARGSVKVTMKEFDEAFTGICLMITPSENFVPGGKKKSTLDFAARRLRGAGAAVAFVVLTTLITYLFGIINPGFTRFFMDRLLTGENRNLLMPFVVLMTAVGVVQIIVSAAQYIYSLKINGKMSVIGNSTFMWKVLKLPMEFYSQRMAGDIQLRQGTNAEIATVLVDTLTPLALNAVMMIVYLVFMLRFSVLLTLVGISTVVINAFAAKIISDQRINVTRVQMRDEGKLASATISGIQMAETIKASGAEYGYFAKWAGYQASVSAQEVQAAKIDAYYGVIPAFFAVIADNVVLVVGIFLTMQGKFSLGSILLFQGFMSGFMEPASTIISAGQTIQEMRTEMERVEDVMQYPDDDLYKDDPLDPEKDYEKLKGNVELRNVTFGYSRLGDPLIEDFSMSMKTGSRVAFVGASGCGKSTLSKLISGMYKPWSGEILFDGKPIDEIDRSVFRGSLAVVDQDIILFEDSISDAEKTFPVDRDRGWRSRVFWHRILPSLSWTKRRAPWTPKRNMSS